MIRKLAPLLITTAALVGCGNQTITIPTNSGTATETTSVADTTSNAGAAAAFSGNGAKNIGAITVHAPSTIAWTCRGCGAFSINGSTNDGAGIIAVVSTSSAGTSAVDAGSYQDVQVISTGNWTIKITPG